MAAPTALTTVFSLSSALSSSCLSNLYQHGTTAVVLGVGTQCLPPGPDPAASSFYSPGLYCPDQWTPACSSTFTSGSVTETRVNCCPDANGLGALSGASFVCQTDENDAASPWHATYGCTMFLGGLAADQSLTVTNTEVQPTTVNLVSVLPSQGGPNAYSVQLRWQLTDLEASGQFTGGSLLPAGSRTTSNVVSTTSSSSTSTTTASSSSSVESTSSSTATPSSTASLASMSSSTSTPPATSSSSSSMTASSSSSSPASTAGSNSSTTAGKTGGISTGAKIAIIVVISVVAFAVIASILVGGYIRYRRRGARSKDLAEDGSPPAEPEMTENDHPLDRSVRYSEIPTTNLETNAPEPPVIAGPSTAAGSSTSAGPSSRGNYQLPPLSFNK